MESMSPKSGVSRVYSQIEKIEEEIYEDDEFQNGVLRLPAEPIVGKRFSRSPDSNDMRISKEILYNYHHPLVHEFQPKAYKSKDELKDLIQVIKGTISNEGDKDIKVGTQTILEEVTNEKHDSSNANATKRTSNFRTSRLKSKKSVSKSNKSGLSQLNRN